MKKCFYTIACWAISVALADVVAQIIPYTPPPRYTIVDELQTPRPGKGGVRINQPDAILRLIGARQLDAETVTTADGRSYMKLQGFRVQVFAGNSQRTSKDEAFRREKEIKELIPTIPTYVTYNAPFWRLRIGDFNSQEEAFHIQRQLMAAFPRYGKEMYIVREDIQIHLDETF
ncbi:MAG: SPOR domain-containing protein [Tannerellaceae bacterium]|nr:SPOR domain-containing protein [Tannerellaceae bacterium]